MFFLNIVKVFVILVAVEAHYYYKHKKSDEKPKCDTCDAVADIIFVYDTSGSIASNQTYFVLMKQFMIAIVDSFNPVGATGTQFAALCFANEPQTHFYLNENNNAPDPKQATIDAINNFPTDINGGTSIGKALEEVRIEFLKTENGIGRPCAQCFVFLMTDGVSNNTPDPVVEANMLRAENCIVYVVPIRLTNSAQMEAIAGGPDNVFSVQNFDLLSTVVQRIVQAACNSSACTSGTDNNGGYSNNYKKSYSHGGATYPSHNGRYNYEKSNSNGGDTKPNYNGGYSNNYRKSYSNGGATYPSYKGGNSDNYGKSYSHGGANTNMNPAPMPNRTPTSYPKYLNQRNNVRDLISRYGYGYNNQPKPSHNHYVYPGQYKK